MQSYRILPLILLFAPAGAGASVYAGAGAAATVNSGHAVLALGYRGEGWRAELGGHFPDRERGSSPPAGSLGPTITAERFDLRTRLFYADASLRLRRRDSGDYSGLELGMGAALLRVVKITRIERNGGLPQIYARDAVWRGVPMLRLAYSKPVHARIDLGVDGRFLMTGDSHGGKGVGGWSLALVARFHGKASP